MKTLKINKMEDLVAGDSNISPGEAFACGLGLATAVLGFAVIGPVALLGVTACMLSDTPSSDR